MSHVLKHREGCHRTGPPVPRVLAQLEEEVLPTLHVAPDDVEAVRDELAALSLADGASAEDELRSLRLRLENERKRANTLLDLRLDSELDEQQYRQKKTNLERSIALMTGRLTELDERQRQRAASIDMVLSVANSLPDLWAKGSEADRRELLEIVFEKLAVGEGRIISSVLREPFRMLERRKTAVPTAFREAVEVRAQPGSEKRS